MYQHSPRLLLSQNFLYNRKLVQQLVGKTSCGKNDIVVEIGPGKGIITQALLYKQCHVIGIEKDPQLIPYLQNNFYDSRFVLFEHDFLEFPLPSSSYKVCSNPPFSVESKIIRKLLNASYPPTDSYLVVRKKPALRWVGFNKQTLFSLSYKPWFDFNIIHYFKGSDFEPKTKLQPVFLHITKRLTPLLHSSDKREYHDFLRSVFGGGGRLRQNLQTVFPKNKVRSFSQKYSFSLQSKPTEISLKTWLALFKEWKGCTIRKV